MYVYIEHDSWKKKAKPANLALAWSTLDRGDWLEAFYCGRLVEHLLKACVALCLIKVAWARWEVLRPCYWIRLSEAPLLALHMRAGDVFRIVELEDVHGAVSARLRQEILICTVWIFINWLNGARCTTRVAKVVIWCSEADHCIAELGVWITRCWHTPLDAVFIVCIECKWSQAVIN